MNIPLVIGKGGMRGVPWGELPAAYLSFPGGVGALVARFITRVYAPVWLDLGSPEALWGLEVKDFGPLLVSMDCSGASLYPAA
jgi:fumarate hydratase subunit beta